MSMMRTDTIGRRIVPFEAADQGPTAALWLDAFPNSRLEGYVDFRLSKGELSHWIQMLRTFG